MSLDFDVVGRPLGPVKSSWSASDALLYALGVGAGQEDPAAELEFTTENTAWIPQRILPTYAVVLAQKAVGLRPDLGDVDPAKLLHAGQTLTLHQPLAVSGSALLTSTVVGIYDKGSGALVNTVTEAADAASGRPLFTATSAGFVRDEGGFGGERATTRPWSAPGRAPDHLITVDTRPDQALLYRLCGDRNPLHSDPAVATAGGYSRPILHGLCTYGITARVLLRALGADPDTLVSIAARFTRPVVPGEKLTVSIWTEGQTHFFRTMDSQGWLVLDHGLAATRNRGEQ